MRRNWMIAGGALAAMWVAAPAAFAQKSFGPAPASNMAAATTSTPTPAQPAASSGARQPGVVRVMYSDVKKLNLTPEERSWIRTPDAAAEPKTLVQVLNKFPNITADDWRSLGKEMEQNGGRVVILRF